LNKLPNFILLSLISLALILCAVRYYLFSPRLLATNGVVFDVPSGMSKSTFIYKLKEQEIFNHDLAYFLFIYLQKNKQLKAGEYFFAEHVVKYLKSMQTQPYLQASNQMMIFKLKMQLEDLCQANTRLLSELIHTPSLVARWCTIT